METIDAEGRSEMTEPREAEEEQNSSERSGALQPTTKRENSNLKNDFLMEAVLTRENMLQALKRVKANKGSAGIDRMTTEMLNTYLMEHWTRIKEELLKGKYKPQPVRGVEIPKPGGKGIRKLGIPTVMDRLIQQALLQILTPIFDPEFSEYSFGFRPNRSAHQAVKTARNHVSQGRRWVIDMDLEKFFDKVNHDLLMTRVARKIKDKRVLKLIRTYLQAGLMTEGMETARTEGTPQGGPLSPLLSNIILDDLDKELEKRGHLFCRYADDCNVYIKSQKAGERVYTSIKRYLEGTLKLKVNEEKSAVKPVWERKFLGYTINQEKTPRLRIAKEAIERFKGKLKEKFRHMRGKNIEEAIKELDPLMRGWISYFRLNEIVRHVEQLDKWIRHHIRCIIWRQLKQPKTRCRDMMAKGVSEQKARDLAGSRKGPWRCSLSPGMQYAYTKQRLENMGLLTLLKEQAKLSSL